MLVNNFIKPVAKHGFEISLAVARWECAIAIVIRLSKNKKSILDFELRNLGIIPANVGSHHIQSRIDVMLCTNAHIFKFSIEAARQSMMMLC